MRLWKGRLRKISLPDTMTSMETVKRTEERNEYSGKVQLQVLMLFPRQLLLAAVRGLLEQINLPPDSAQPCLYYVWERDPRRGPCSYSLDCIKKSQIQH